MTDKKVTKFELSFSPLLLDCSTAVAVGNRRNNMSKENGIRKSHGNKNLIKRREKKNSSYRYLYLVTFYTVFAYFAI